MVITYFGEGCFRLQSGETSILLDPVSNRLKADIYVRTLTPSEGEDLSLPGVIAFPGEYEMKGIEVEGYGVPAESTAKFLKTAYAIQWEDVRIVVLGHLSKLPGVEVMEKLGEPDVLIVPVGGGHFLSAEDATKTIKQIEPSVVIPSFYKNLNDFWKAFGHKASPEEKFVFKKKDLAANTTVVVPLEAKTSA